MASLELIITRIDEQIRNGRRRTAGNYQIEHYGVNVDQLTGMAAETRGPGDNSTTGNNRCVELGKYDLYTQAGQKYVTIGYTSNVNPAALKRPGLLLALSHQLGSARRGVWRARSPQAAVAARHVRNASSRRTRSVRREVR
jgi:hypothetical protein